MDEKPNASKHAGKASVIVSQLKGLQGEMSTLQDDIQSLREEDEVFLTAYEQL